MKIPPRSKAVCTDRATVLSLCRSDKFSKGGVKNVTSANYSATRELLAVERKVVDYNM